MALDTMYAGKVNSPATTLDGGINDSVTTINVVDGTVLPDAPNLAVIGTGEDAETILYETKNGNELSDVTRGFQGVAKEWDDGTPIARLFTAYDYDTLKENIADLDSRVGEANTASNIGGYEEIFKQKEGVDLEFRTLRAGTGIDIYNSVPTDTWDIANCSYDTVSKDVSSQDSSPNDVAFNSDGSKMYIVGSSSDTVYQYTLSTPWNVSTATYDSISKDVSSQESSPYGVAFNSDGSKMYIVGSKNKTVFQYTLSTPWNVSTATYDTVSKNVSSQDSIPYGVAFNSDGSKMYIVGGGNDTVFQYTVGGTAEYDYVQVDVTPDDIKLDDLGAPDDNTDLNASTSAHGLMPKLDNNPIHFINGQGSWTIPHKVVTIADGDTTPDVSGGDIFVTSANTGATKITDLDNPPVGQIITLIGGSDTNASTIPDGASINAVSFTGTGLDDATSGGTFTGTEDTNYKVEIDGVGEIDTFKWSDDGGATWEATLVAITGGAQELNNGVTITFGATTGHTVGDYWTFTAYPDRFKLSATMTLNLDDSIMLFVKADNYYIELSRSAN